MKTDMRVITIPDFIIFLKSIGTNIDKSMSDLCFDTRITYSHLHTLKKVFLEKKWIFLKKDGKKHIPILTPEGHQLLNACDDLLDELEITDKDILEFRKKHKTKEKEEEEIIEERIEEVNKGEVLSTNEVREELFGEDNNEIVLEDDEDDEDSRQDSNAYENI